MNTENTSNTNSQSFDNLFVESADQFLDELGQLATTSSDRKDFYGVLVERLHGLLNADDVSVWVCQEEQPPVRVIQRRSQDLNPAVNDWEGECLHRHKETNTTTTTSDGSHSVFAIPVSLENERKLISFVIGEEIDSRLANVYCDLGEAVSDLSLNFERRLTVENQQQKFSKLESFVQLLRNSSDSLDLEKVGYHLTNDCRSFLDAGRVWLFSTDGRTKLVACSSVNEVNPRSRSFGNLRNLVVRAIKLQQTLSCLADESTFKNDVATNNEVDEYVKSESLNGFYLRLLKRNVARNDRAAETTGVLVVEYFSPHDQMATLTALNNIVPCVESSVSNALTFTKIPFRRTLQNVRWLFDQIRLNRLPRTLLVLGCLIGLLAATFLIETDFEIDVSGELRPVVERHVFAPVDSTVDTVLVDYGDVVSKGQTIASLVSPEYELKTSSLQNDLSAAQKELEANQILHTQASNEGKDSLHLGQLSAEIEQNRLEVEGINKKIEWYLEKADQLKIGAPISGVVISRDVQLSLLKRPVRAGNQLLTIANTKSDWQIVFKIPDREFGYLLDAKRNNDVNKWSMNYRFQSDLGTTFHSAIEKTDNNNSFDDEGNVFVNAYVPVSNDGGDFRVGQTVVGKIHCGRKSLFYVWTRDVRDFIKSNFFWM